MLMTLGLWEAEAKTVYILTFHRIDHGIEGLVGNSDYLELSRRCPRGDFSR